MRQDNDWKITPKQQVTIQGRIQYLSKREASILINIIEAIYQSRPSSQNLQDNSEKIGSDQPSTQLGDQ